MICKKDIINLVKTTGMLSLFTLSFSGCSEEESDISITNKTQREQSGDLQEIVTLQNKNNNAVYFSFNAKTDARPESITAMDNAVSFLNAHSGAYLILTGHVDAIAANQMVNYSVALDRAYKTKQYLMGKGVDSSRIYIKATTKQSGRPAHQERRVDFEYTASTPNVGLVHIPAATKEKKSAIQKSSCDKKKKSEKISKIKNQKIDTLEESEEANDDQDLV
jgi:hypothetical protein